MTFPNGQHRQWTNPIHVPPLGLMVESTSGWKTTSRRPWIRGFGPQYLTCQLPVLGTAASLHGTPYMFPSDWEICILNVFDMSTSAWGVVKVTAAIAYCVCCLIENVLRVMIYRRKASRILCFMCRMFYLPQYFLIVCLLDVLYLTRRSQELQNYLWISQVLWASLICFLLPKVFFLCLVTCKNLH